MQQMCQESMAGVKKTRSRSQPNARKTSSCQSVTSRNEESPKQDCLSHTSLRQLKAKIEAENQQVQEMIQPLLEAENGFLKELECFLTQQEVAELRRKEFLHKRWTERVWLPLQKRVEQHMSSHSRRQSLCYLRHSSSKGPVSLDTYDPQVYKHFLFSFKKLQHFKFKAADLSERPVFSYKKNRIEKHTMNKKFSSHPDSIQSSSTSVRQGAAEGRLLAPLS